MRTILLSLFSLMLALPASGQMLSSSSANDASAQSFPAYGAAGPTLSKVRAANTLTCGINVEEGEYTNHDAHGDHSALDQQLCQAIAVAVLGEKAVAKLVTFRDEEEALAGLKKGSVDVLAAGSVNYMDTAAQHLGFTHPIFYDTLGLMVNKSSGLHSAADLAGKQVCFLVGGEAQEQLQTYMNRVQPKWIPFSFSEEGEMEAAFVINHCSAISADLSQLAYERTAFRNMAPKFEILPDILGKDPLAVTYRTDDPQWGQILNWVVNVLILAEESGVTRANVSQMLKSDDLMIKRLLGTQKGYAPYLGLEDGWSAKMLAVTGNYGEIWDKAYGDNAVVHLPRGLNNLWTHGGLMFGDPIR